MAAAAATATTMRAVIFDRKAEETKVASGLAVPEAGVGEVLVRVDSAALNPVDAKVDFWKGLLPADDGKTPFILGVDGCGTVVATGDGVPAEAVGSRILFHSSLTHSYGTFAEYTLAGWSTSVVVKPSEALLARGDPGLLEGGEVTELGDTEAGKLAAIPCAAWTAWSIVHDQLHVNKDDTVLVYGASGGVGSFVLQFCRAIGAEKIIAVCSGKNAEHCRALGATHVVDYRNPGAGSVEEAVRALTEEGRGVDKATDLVGEATSRVCADLLAFGGVVCPASNALGPDSTQNAMLRATAFAHVMLGGAHMAGTRRARQWLQRTGIDCTRAILQSGMEVPITGRLALDQVPEALKAMLEAHTTGKIVVDLARQG